MPVTALGFHVMALVALGALAIHTLLNHLAQPRLALIRAPRHPRRISVLIPARNEAGRIVSCLRAWSRQRYPDYEIVVYDDDSSDETLALARRVIPLGRGRVAHGGALPPGWRGKPHACHELRHLATGDILLFVDADVTPAPDALERTAGAFDRLGVDVLSLVPTHTSPSVWVRGLVALQNWAAAALVPSWLPSSPGRPWLAALNGQFVALPATVYDASGGFASVRATVAEDIAFGRRLVGLGYRVRLLDGAGVIVCEPYRRLGDLWRATVRNLLPILFRSRLLLLATLSVLAGIVLGPLVVLVGGDASGPSGTMALIEIALGLASRVVTDRRAGYPLWLALTHPAAVATLVLMGVDAVVRSLVGGTVEWRGRRYTVADDTRRSA